MQIAAADPKFVRRGDVDEDVLAKEREIARDRALAEGKPEKIVDKIVEGRLGKFFEEICLYEQPFVKENSSSVEEVIKAKIAKLGENITVPRFARFKIGEAIEADSAAEEPAE